MVLHNLSHKKDEIPLFFNNLNETGEQYFNKMDTEKQAHNVTHMWKLRVVLKDAEIGRLELQLT